MTSLLLLIHLLAAIFWLGGMAFMLWVLRPSLMQTIEASKRLSVMQSVLKRFLTGVWIAVVLLLISGLILFFYAGANQWRVSVHIMFTLGLVMSGVFAYIYFVLYPKFCIALDQQDMAVPASTLSFIQKLVLINFFLGLLAVALIKLW